MDELSINFELQKNASESDRSQAKLESQMLKPKILIVDDEIQSRELLGEILLDKYDPLFASTAQEALSMAQTSKPAAILVDVFMPGMKGTQLVEALRRQQSTETTPIIMITGSDELETRMECFEQGADDFIAKPVYPQELIVRIDSKIKRVQLQKEASQPSLHVGDLVLDLIGHTLKIANVDVSIGEIEFKILHCLISKKGQLVSREELNQFIWNGDLPSERAMDPHITSLRKKLNSIKVELRTIYGRGYSIIERT